MSPKNTPIKWPRPVVAMILPGLVFGLGAAAAYAADRTFSGTVTGAFETVVIDATKAAGKATAAAKNALAAEPDKSKPSKKDGAKSRKDKDDASPPKGAAEVPKPPNVADKNAASKAKSPDGKNTAAEPAAKAAEGAKPIDPKTGKPVETTKKAEPPTEWPAVDVELARARCTQLLKGLDAVTLPEAPFRKGDCGSMAPVRLISIGKNPEVSLSPPPVVSCDMVVALTQWMKDDVQPAARRHLGAEVIRMESMSDYSCRMAYGRIGNKLSEHGKANALDIRGFTTRKGSQAVVLTDWGQTKRDVLKQIAAAKAAAAKTEAAKAAAEQAAKERAEAAANTSKPAAIVGSAPLPRKTLVEGLPPKAGERDKSLARPAALNKETALGMSPTGLGGPKDDKKSRQEAAPKQDKQSKKPEATVAALPPAGAATQVVAPPPKNAVGRFLREVHAGGCRTFGTTLGPEANEAHRNHFHVDMAERKIRKICD